MKQITIDRFDGIYAICEDKDKAFFAIETSELPQGAKAGDVLKITDDGALSIDVEETERRRAIESIRNVIRAAMYEDAAGSAYEVEPCPRCGSAATVKKGKAGNGEQRYLCRGCGRTFGMGSERILVQVVQDLHGCRRGRCRAHGRAAVCEREL